MMDVGSIWRIRDDAPEWAKHPSRRRIVEIISVGRRFGVGPIVGFRPVEDGRAPGKKRIVEVELFERIYEPRPQEQRA